MHRLNHHHLYLFWVFGRTRSFTRTAAELAIAQSAVTSQIKQLENFLALDLVDRSNPKKPELTPEGKKVLEYAEIIFESSRELLTWSGQGASRKQKRVRIGALSGLSRNLQYEFMKPLLGREDVRFEVMTGDQKILIDELGNHHLDVVLTSQNIGTDYRTGMLVHTLTSSPLVFVQKKKKSRSHTSLEKALSTMDLYLPGSHFEAKPELEAYLESLKVPVRVSGEIDDVALLRILALRTDGLVAIPELGVRTDIGNGDLSVVAKLDRIQQRFYAITRKRLNPMDELGILIQRFS